jgi:phosphoribosylanthranilate isomerase
MAAPLLKICGLRDPGQAEAVAALGVDAIGVIGVAASPRHVLPGARRALWQVVAAAAPACRRVLVVADPSDDQLAQLTPECGHQVLQLHGSETPERCADLRQKLAVEVWKALRIRRPEDLAAVAAYGAVVDGLLLDAWVSDQLGGSGQRIPLQWLAGFAPPGPWWLAGGIRPELVAEVLTALSPTGLDASSGVERSPADKDLDRVRQLVTAVNAWPGDGG